MFNTYWVMVLPGCVSAYNTFVFRSFFQGIPASLHESARVDGAIEPVIWARIILPLSKPLLATFFLFTMVGHWNSCSTPCSISRTKTAIRCRWFCAAWWCRKRWAQCNPIALPRFLLRLLACTRRTRRWPRLCWPWRPSWWYTRLFQKHFAKGVMIGAIKG